MKKQLMTAAAIAILAVTGCAAGEGMPSPKLTFANYQPVRLNVKSADVVENYSNVNDPQDVSSQFVVTPVEAVKRYAARRFAASGSGTGQFTIEITDSRVHLRQIKQDSKVLAAMDAGTEDEYHVWLALRVTPQPDGFNGRMGATTIKMDRTLVMRSSVSLAERELKQVQFLEQLIADLDVKINDTIHATPAILR